MIAALKTALFQSSKQIGLSLRLSDSRWRRRRLLVICYHGVSLVDEHEWNPELYISARTFVERLDALARMQCAVLRLDEAIARLYAGTLPDRAVTLTFDDGFYDFKAVALPALRARGYPATVYVTTHRSVHDGRSPVGHLLASYLLWTCSQPSLDARGIAGLDRVYSLRSPADRRLVIANMAVQVRRERLHPEDERAFIRAVMERVDVDCDAASRSCVLSTMSPGDLQDVVRDGVAVEMHTHRHCTPDDPDEFVDDVRINRDRVEALTGRRPQHLCYPNGRYRSAYIPKLEREGIESATTCDPGLASPRSHRLLLPRFVDSEVGTAARFDAWVTGVASWLPRRT